MGLVWLASCASEPTALPSPKLALFDMKSQRVNPFDQTQAKAIVFLFVWTDCLISMLVKRKIKWDAAKEEIIGDAEATKLLSRPYRAPLKLT